MNSEKLLREALERIASFKPSLECGDWADKVDAQGYNRAGEYAADIARLALAKPSPAPVEREGVDDAVIGEFAFLYRQYGLEDDAKLDSGALELKRKVLAALAPEPVRWMPVADLTDEDGYVLGWSERDDGVLEREFFFGRRYDIRKDALINEWTGKWRAITHWSRLPAAPLSAREGE